MIFIDFILPNILNVFENRPGEIPWKEDIGFNGKVISQYKTLNYYCSDFKAIFSCSLPLIPQD